MKSRISRLFVAAGVVALLTAGCNVNPQQASQAAERVMTVAAQITPEAVETAMASSPVGTPAVVAIAESPIVYARCITRGTTTLLQLPQDGATEAAPLGSRSIITAFGRTADAAWVLGWNAANARGWLPASIIGCTAPVEDLRVTDAGLLLTPTVMAVAEATTAATSEATLEATSEATQTPPATVMINAVTATPEATLESIATAAPATSAATPTEAPIPTATALPTDVPIPTAAPTRTTLPTATPLAALAATAAPTSPVRVITVVVVVTATPPQTSVLVPQPEEKKTGEAQVRDLRCTVTPGTPVNLRNGPARAARLLELLQPSTRFLAQGRNADATWIYGFTERQMPGWLIASSVECDGDPAQLVEVDR